MQTVRIDVMCRKCEREDFVDADFEKNRNLASLADLSMPCECGAGAEDMIIMGVSVVPFKSLASNRR